jgi:hypothetical protein
MFQAPCGPGSATKYTYFVFRRMIEREARNLYDFTERMKKLYYKDWSEFPC